MDYKIEVYDALCSTSVFIINSINADEDDFIDKYDHAPGIAEPYGCGDMRADVIEPTKDVLNKYKINEKEFYKIANELAEKVSFGNCGWCI